MGSGFIYSFVYWCWWVVMFGLYGFQIPLPLGFTHTKLCLVPFLYVNRRWCSYSLSPFHLFLSLSFHYSSFSLLLFTHLLHPLLPVSMSLLRSPFYVQPCQTTAMSNVIRCAAWESVSSDNVCNICERFVWCHLQCQGGLFYIVYKVPWPWMIVCQDSFTGW